MASSSSLTHILMCPPFAEVASCCGGRIDDCGGGGGRTTAFLGDVLVRGSDIWLLLCFVLLLPSLCIKRGAHTVGTYRNWPRKAIAVSSSPPRAQLIAEGMLSVSLSVSSPEVHTTFMSRSHSV